MNSEPSHAGPKAQRTDFTSCCGILGKALSRAFSSINEEVLSPIEDGEGMCTH